MPVKKESDVLIRLRLAGEEFSRGYKEEFSKLEAEAERSGGVAAERFSAGSARRIAALTAAASAAVVGIAALVNQSLKLGTEISATSKQLGIGVETLQEYQFVAEQTGVTQSELETGIQQLTKAIGEGANGTKRYSEGFEALGISLTDVEGRGRSTEEILKEVVSTLNAIEDPSERARLGAQLMGEQYQQLEPIMALGADGVDQLTDRLHDLNGVLSEEQIANLQETNAKFDEMQRILSVNIADAVANNAEELVYLAGVLGDIAQKSIEATAEFSRFIQSVANEPLISITNPSSQDAAFGSEFLGPFQNFTEFANSVRGSGSRSRQTTPPRPPSFDRTVKPVSGSRAKTGRSGPTAEQREQLREAERLTKEFERQQQSLEMQLLTLSDAAAIAEIRNEQGDLAADLAESQLNIERQFPELINTSSAALAEKFGITVQEVEKNKELLQLLKDQGQAAVINKELDRLDKDFEESIGEAEDQIREAQKRLAEEQRRIQMDVAADISDFYFDLFQGNTGDIWKDFKQQGLSVISDIAAQWTLALITGQDASLDQIAGNVLGQTFPGGGSPLGSLLGAVDGGIFRNAANDNFNPSALLDPASFQLGGDGLISGQSFAETGSNTGFPGGGFGGGFGGALGGAGVGLGISSLTKALGLGGSSTGGAIGGAAGSFLPIPGGQIIGSIVGSLIGGLFKTSRTARANITSADSISLGGKDSKNFGTASGLAGSVVGGLQTIAEQLGASLGSFNTTIGVRGGDFRVNRSGTSLKTSKGARDFGDDEEAAIRFALADAISDGAIKGISDASQRILKSGQDLETAIDKALMIEEIPKLLAQRLDPVGFELDQIQEKFSNLADVLREGGASADQIAEARQLWELERADAIREIGDASEGLKDFLLSLNAGTGSPLSLRQQQREAEEAFKPFLDQISAAEAARAELDQLRASGASEADIKAAEDAARIAAAAIDQSGFQSSGQLLLGIERQINASGSGFFDQFDRIRDLTNSAITLIDNAVPMQGEVVDPFVELTANNTTNMANILDDQTKLLQALNDNFASFFGGGGFVGFEPRNFASV